MEDNSYVDCTEDHHFLTKEGYKLEIDTAFKRKIELKCIKEQ
jgi:hypothetical protein